MSRTTIFTNTVQVVTCADDAVHEKAAVVVRDGRVTGVIPAERHKAITKQARQTNHIERFNNTLRQRLSRLVRATLSFSKKVENHIGAIKFFICHYNLEKAAALPL